ncbi:MAG: CAP domain-containing protein, partial [Anaerolineae bacterium]|nr:CAP domain-containing protein [Anaerolineae bacterium]
MNIKRFFPLFIFLLAVLCSAPAHAQDVVGELLGRINGLRASLGLPGYTLNGALTSAAANHAQWMVNTGQISHTQADGSTPSSRAAAAGYGGRWVSENIYAGSSAGIDDAWTFWINSSIHYRGLTNPNYQEIGIATASSGWGRSFVLVFGSTASAAYVPPAASGGSGGGRAASGPPPFVVGLDNYGNIMHEVQPQQTIGDILLIYGYTWEDLPYFLTLNGKSDTDIRRLQIGEVVLVPPYEGTYTPTPLPEGWPTNTPEPTASPEPADFVATAIAEAAIAATQAAQTPTPTQTLHPTVTAA